MQRIQLENTVWFLRSTGGVYNPPSSGIEGSAVAIKLQQRGKPLTASTFLLTCSHAIRSNKGLGPEFEHIVAWKPGNSQDGQFGAIVKPRFRPAEATPEYVAKDDWVILEFTNPAQATGETVGPWKIKPLSELSVIGYPGGAESFSVNGVVRPTTVGPFPILHQGHTNVRLIGDATRSGMSGGGVFDSVLFAGIHRGRQMHTMQLDLISSASLKSALSNWDLEPAEQWRTDEFVKLQTIAGYIEGEIWRNAYSRALPLTTDALSHLIQGNEPIEDALIRLMEFNADESKLRPVDKLVRLLAKDERLAPKTQDGLAQWLTQFSAIDDSDSTKPRVACREPVKEPRIVIRMRPATRNEAFSPFPHGDSGAGLNESEDKTLYNYEIWFVGFEKSPSCPAYVDYRHVFPSMVQWAWEFVKCEHAPNKVWVELSLPRGVLHAWPVEREKVQLDKYTNSLGTKHHFILRSEDRVYPKWVEDRMREANKRSENCGEPIRLHFVSMEDNTDDDKSHYLVELDGKLDCRVAHGKLERRKTVLAAYLNSAPKQLTSEKDINALDGVLDSGIPLVLWLRHDAPDGQNILSDRLQQREWDSVFPELQKIRSEAAVAEQHEWRIGRELAVILDTPQRPMPDDSTSGRMRSPH